MATTAVAVVATSVGISAVGSSAAVKRAASTALPHVGVNQVVVKGVPTLAQLYKGTESAPPTSGPKPVKNKTVWWISCGQSVPDCAYRASMAQQAGKLLGWTVRIADTAVGANNGYVTAIKTALATHPSAIIEDAIGCNTNTAALELAKAQHVPVLGEASLDCPKSEFTVPMYYDTTLKTASDFWEAWGKISADYIIDATDGKAQLINNLGTGDNEFTLQDKGFNEEFAKCKTCKLLTNVSWTVQDLVPNGAWITALRTALTKYPNVNVVYMPFSFMESSLGGAQAMKEAGVKALGVGGSGTYDSLDLIDQGLWNADTGSYSFGWISYAAIDELNRYFNHEPAVPEGVGFVVVDKQNRLPTNLKDNYNTSVNYVAAYKKIWGLK